MPTSPTIAEFIGKYGLWIICGIIIIAIVVALFSKPDDGLPAGNPKSLPWQRPDRK